MYRAENVGGGGKRSATPLFPDEPQPKRRRAVLAAALQNRLARMAAEYSVAFAVSSV